MPGSIRAIRFGNTLPNYQTLQISDKSQCVDLKYSINSTEESVKFSLTIEQNFISAFTDDNSLLDVIVFLKDCPYRFIFSNVSRGCECHPEIEKYSVQCNINNQSFLLPPNSWMGFHELCTTESCPVLFNPKCPKGYCSLESVSTNSSYPDNSCYSNRTGALCGSCKVGYSIALGSSVCMACDNFSLLLVIPMALAGLFLIVILFTLNLTVTEGTINGFLFYANVIGLHYRELFVVETSYLYPFLAWINLDLGINTCFYDGLDYYFKTWLHLVFPAYLWSIILIIVLLQKKFPTFSAKCGGDNTVSVVATLMLMTFTKLINTVTTILSFTQLGTEHMWFYDASRRYFKDEHIFLGITGLLVIVFLILPYLLFVSFFQQIQACGGDRIYKWMNRLTPLYDAYVGPYKDKCQFWTGMLLLVRIGLVILFNSTRSLYVNLFVTVIVSFALAAACSNGIYKKWPCSFLELVFFCLLGIFAAGISYFKYIEKNITPFSDVSIGLSIFVFFGTVTYHGYCRIKGCHCHRKKYERIVPPNNPNLVESNI